MRFIQIHPSDNVAVALENLKAGENAGVILREDIGRGHKFALRPIRNGENIVKYGMPIGTAKNAKNTTKHIRNTTAFHALKPDLAFAAAFISAAAVEFMLISVTVALSWK